MAITTKSDDKSKRRVTHGAAWEDTSPDWISRALDSSRGVISEQGL